MEPDLTRKWVLQWREAAHALRAVRARELQELSDQRAIQTAQALLELASRVPVEARRYRHSGLVEQQHLFSRLTP